MTRLMIAAGLLLTSTLAAAGSLQVYKSPSCGCCTAWAEHMRDNG